MKLIPVETLRTRLNLPVDDGVTETLSRAIEGATPVLESMVGSQFAQAEHSDVFFVRTGYISPYPTALPLQLRHGFVDEAQEFEVFGANTLAALVAGGTAVTDIHMKAELGHVVIPDKDFTYYKVVYTAGVPDTVEGVATLPSWVREAAASQAILSLSAMQVGDGKESLSETYQFLGRQLGLLVDSHTRRRGNYLRPM